MAGDQVRFAWIVTHRLPVSEGSTTETVSNPHSFRRSSSTSGCPSRRCRARPWEIPGDPVLGLYRKGLHLIHYGLEINCEVVSMPNSMKTFGITTTGSGTAQGKSKLRKVDRGCEFYPSMKAKACRKLQHLVDMLFKVGRRVNPRRIRRERDNVGKLRLQDNPAATSKVQYCSARMSRYQSGKRKAQILNLWIGDSRFDFLHVLRSAVPFKNRSSSHCVTGGLGPAPPNLSVPTPIRLSLISISLGLSRLAVHQRETILSSRGPTRGTTPQCSGLRNRVNTPFSLHGNSTRLCRGPRQCATAELTVRWPSVAVAMPCLRSFRAGTTPTGACPRRPSLSHASRQNKHLVARALVCPRTGADGSGSGANISVNTAVICPIICRKAGESSHGGRGIAKKSTGTPVTVAVLFSAIGRTLLVTSRVRPTAMQTRCRSTAALEPDIAFMERQADDHRR